MSDTHLLTVYKAAAGSGKTYTLTQEYLRHILQPQTGIRHILAITFTNAATADMKQKIVQALSQVADGRYPDWKKLLEENERRQTETSPEEESRLSSSLRQRASAKLAMLLHQYQDFSVKTIDSFVQNLIKPFAFELGLPQNYTPSIEIDALTQDITQKLLQECGPNGDACLTAYMQAFLEKREAEEKNLNIAKSIRNVVGLLFAENSMAPIESLRSIPTEGFQALIDRIEAYCARTESSVNAIWEKANRMILQSGAEANDFHGGSTGFFKWFTQKPHIPTYADPKTSILNAIEKGILKNGAYPELAEALQQCFCEIRSIDFPNYFLAREVLRNIYAMALLHRARQILEEIQEKTSVIPLPEFNRKIDEALSREGNEFIFERSGTRYRHVFIDEFQDTSRLQWKNLRPLVENNLAQGNECLIVGDPKQSIYRFRNADLEQFIRLCSQKADIPVKVKTLQSNWRSTPGIIAFNNDFFRFIKEHYPFLPGPDDEYYARMAEGGQERDPAGALTRIVFEQHEQFYRTQTRNLPLPEPEAVRIYQARNLSGETLQQWYLDQILRIVRCHKPGQTAILCHRNTHCRLVSDFLVQQGYKVSTPDSLTLKSHRGICLLIASLEYLDAKRNYHKAKTYVLARQLRLWPNTSEKKDEHLHEEWKSPATAAVFSRLEEQARCQADLYDTVEAIIRFWKMDRFPDQYLLCFLDKIQELKYSRISDALRWWDEKGKNTCISSDADDDSLRVMSIHKSKGLEFNVVILPFISDYTLLNSSLFWTQSGTLPEDFGLPSALVHYVNSIAGSRVGPDMERERQHIEIDNLNALYVAMTRACEKLYIVNRIPSRPGRRFSSELAIAQFAEQHPEYVEYEEDGAVLSTNETERPPENFSDSGTRQPEIPSVEAMADTAPYENAMPEFPSFAWRENFTSASEREEELSDERRWGSFLHRALSYMEHDSEEEKAKAVAVALQDFPEFRAESTLASEMIGQVVSCPRLHPYFSGDYWAKSETALAVSATRTLIPDRVFLKGNEAAVLDYKTGEAHASHRRQVAEYMQLLRRMGFTSCKGFLVYVGNGIRIEEVSEIPDC